MRHGELSARVLLNVARARGLRRLLESRYYLARTIWPSRREEIEAVILAELDAVAIEAQAMRDQRADRDFSEPPKNGRRSI